MALTVRVAQETFDPGAEIDKLHGKDPAIGAVASFIGTCRDEGGRLAALELEHFPGMAEDELTRIGEEALQRWPLYGLTILHRHGKLAPGEQIVFVAASSSHRRAALQAVDFVMDFLKTDAPFWKKEHPKGGAEGGWVEAKASDDADRDRWNKKAPV